MGESDSGILRTDQRLADGGASNSPTLLSASGASAVVRQERLSRREALRAVIARNPNGKLADKASALLLDFDRFEDWLRDAGGDDELLFIICAQVASGVSLKALCRHYVVDYGLLWAWLSAEPERLRRYELALRGLADGYVAEAVDVADETEPDDAAHGKLRVDTRLRVAGVLDRKRFGTEKVSQVAGPTIVFDAGLVGAAAELLGRIRGAVTVEASE